MSVHIQATLFCTDCPNSTWEYVEGQTPSQARRDGRKLCWTQRRKDGRIIDVCPFCNHDRVNAERWGKRTGTYISSDVLDAMGEKEHEK